jgi:hypothetical protein
VLLVSRLRAGLAAGLTGQPVFRHKEERSMDLMRAFYANPSVAVVVMLSTTAAADCPLDHLLIGCNPDGIAGTGDDMKLFVDCTMKYRHSDPNQSGEAAWLNWYYPLYYNERYDRYQIDEPGFELIEDSDPNRRLTGSINIDHRLIITCLSISPDFAVWNSTIGVIFDEPGDTFNYSGSWNTHLHLQYRTATRIGETELLWVTLQIYDEIESAGQYEVSEPFSIIFVREPLAGDLAVDGTVDLMDLVEFSYYWLGDEGSRANDYYERADANKDGKVDFYDFALMASNWKNDCQVPEGHLNSENCK